MGGIVLFAGLLDDPAPLPPNPAAANVKDLHGGFQVVVGERDDVGVGPVAEHHRLLLQRTLERTDVVAQAGGPLEVQLCRGGVHLPLQVARETIGLAGQEIAEVHHDLPMLGGADPINAGGRALVDVAEQARTLDLSVPLEYSR